MSHRILVVLTLVLAGDWAGAARMPATDVTRLTSEPATRAALRIARDEEPATLDEQVRLCEIPAPPFKEGERARALMAAFRAVGLRSVRLDREGNVLGERPGRSAAPHLVVSAHLDTVFPEGTTVAVARDGRVLRGPGIGDDCRGLAVLVAVARALNGARIETEGPITFVATVGEEGLGDLRGVKALFAETLANRIDRFISIDGAGLDITHRSVGSVRYRVTFKGPGGHSYDAFGQANPVHALGRAIAAVSDLRVPADPKTTFNVGRVGGGTSINAIAAEAWMEADLRSVESGALEALEKRFLAAVDGALAAENTRWKQAGRLRVEKQLVGRRPAGQTPHASELVQAAIAATRAVGGEPVLSEASTDSNVPMSLNIPAVTLGGGGTGSGAHSLAETFDTRNSWIGTQRAVLVAIAWTEP